MEPINHPSVSGGRKLDKDYRAEVPQYLVREGYAMIAGLERMAGAMLLSPDITEQVKLRMLERREELRGDIVQEYGLSKPVVLGYGPRLVEDKAEMMG